VRRCHVNQCHVHRCHVFVLSPNSQQLLEHLQDAAGAVHHRLVLLGVCEPLNVAQGTWRKIKAATKTEKNKSKLFWVRIDQVG
jgi:hypothetical protein